MSNSLILNQHTGILNKHTEILNQHTRILNQQSEILNTQSGLIEQTNDTLKNFTDISVRQFEQQQNFNERFLNKLDEIANKLK
jgi:ABC-type transporter Mla subunit MlaD